MHSNRTAILSCQNQMSLIQAICIRKSSIHKSIQPMKGCELMSNRYKKMHSNRTAILSCQNQMSLIQAICIRKSSIHKSLQLLKGCESMSNRNPQMHSNRTAIFLCQNQMLLMQASCIRKGRSELKNPHNFPFPFVLKAEKSDHAIHGYTSASRLFGG
jgi:hypothetical protein